MFYWYFPKENGNSSTKMIEDTPLIVWLNGGPGFSLTFTALTENGPLTIQPNGTVNRNPNSWSTVADIVYIDPVLGIGYSSIGDQSHRDAYQEMVAKDSREFIVRFIEKFPNLKNRRFFLAGEHDAGHYVPALGNLLLKSPIEDLDFVGIAIGNGWVDAKSQFPAFADFAFERKLIGEDGFRIAKEALKSCFQSLETDRRSGKVAQCLQIATGLVGRKSLWDIRLNCEVPPICYNPFPWFNFINRDDVQSALGAHRETEQTDESVVNIMTSDSVIEYRTKVEELLKAGKQILVYSGDQDFMCNWRGGEAWVNNIEWEKQDEFRSKPYSNWEVNGSVFGAMRQIDNLTFLRVFNAGHMVPMDQPEAALAMITSFMTNNFHDDFKMSSEMIESNKKGSSFLALS